MNLKQLFCFHDWVPFRSYERKHHEVRPALSDLTSHSLVYIDDNPNVLYCVLSKEHMFPNSDDFCPKCEKFNLRLTRWLTKRDKEYHDLRDSLIEREKMMEHAKRRAKELVSAHA